MGWVGGKGRGPGYRRVLFVATVFDILEMLNIGYLWGFGVAEAKGPGKGLWPRQRIRRIHKALVGAKVPGENKRPRKGLTAPTRAKNPGKG